MGLEKTKTILSCLAGRNAKAELLKASGLAEPQQTLPETPKTACSYSRGAQGTA